MVQEFSPCANVSTGNLPVFLSYSRPPEMGVEQKDAAHSANYGKGRLDLCLENGVECHLVYPGAMNVKYPTGLDFVVDNLLK
jgi:hypothetical protein